MKANGPITQHYADTCNKTRGRGWDARYSNIFARTLNHWVWIKQSSIFPGNSLYIIPSLDYKLALGINKLKGTGLHF